MSPVIVRGIARSAGAVGDARRTLSCQEPGAPLCVDARPRTRSPRSARWDGLGRRGRLPGRASKTRPMVAGRRCSAGGNRRRGSRLGLWARDHATAPADSSGASAGPSPDRRASVHECHQGSARPGLLSTASSRRSRAVSRSWSAFSGRCASCRRAKCGANARPARRRHGTRSARRWRSRARFNAARRRCD